VDTDPSPVAYLMVRLLRFRGRMSVGGQTCCMLHGKGPLAHEHQQLSDPTVWLIDSSRAVPVEPPGIIKAFQHGSKQDRLEQLRRPQPTLLRPILYLIGAAGDRNGPVPAHSCPSLSQSPQPHSFLVTLIPCTLLCLLSDA
jgi:hypothetical protein